jgi:hypothetical protein
MNYPVEKRDPVLASKVDYYARYITVNKGMFALFSIFLSPGYE